MYYGRKTLVEDFLSHVRMTSYFVGVAVSQFDDVMIRAKVCFGASLKKFWFGLG